MPINVDVGNIGGNVTFQVYHNKLQISENEYHNRITDAGITNMLNCLVRNTSSYITGISIMTGDVSDPQDHKFYSFSSARLVQGDSPYAEFKFYLGTNGPSIDDINGKNIIGARLLSNDSVNREIVFSEVTTASVIDGQYEDDGITPKKVFTVIEKTSDIAVVVIWRIGITSIFTDIIQ